MKTRSRGPARAVPKPEKERQVKGLPSLLPFGLRPRSLIGRNARSSGIGWPPGSERGQEDIIRKTLLILAFTLALSLGGAGAASPAPMDGKAGASGSLPNAPAAPAPGLEALERSLRQVAAAKTETSAEYVAALTAYGEGLHAAAKYPEAETALRQAVALAERLAADEANVLRPLSALAETLTSLNKHREAGEFYRKAVALSTRAFGEADGRSIKAMRRLDYHLMITYQHRDSVPLRRKILEILEKSKGESDLETIQARYVLGSTLSLLGIHDEAETLLARAVQDRTALLGEKHRETLFAMQYYAFALADNGKWAQAKEVARRFFTHSKVVFGERDQFTVQAITLLAGFVEEEEAEPLRREALALAREVLGEDHHVTVSATAALGRTLYNLDRSAEAEPLLRRAVELSSRALGEENPNTINAMRALASVVSDLGRAGEAERLYRRVLTLRKREEGDSHPDTLKARVELAGILEDGPGAQEAETLLSEAVTLSSKFRGDAHPDTIYYAARLANYLLARPAQAAAALDPARLAVGGAERRMRNLGSTPIEERQLADEASDLAWYSSIFANAAWSAGTADSAARTDLRAQAFIRLQDAMSSPASQALALMAARNVAEEHGAGLGEVARQRQLLADQWSANESAQTETLVKGGSDSALKLENLQRQGARLEAEMARMDKRLRDEAPAYHALVRPEPLDIEAAQRLLRKDEAALMVVPTAHGTHVMVVTRESLKWHRSDLKTRDVNEAVRRLRKELDPAAASRGGLSVFSRTGETRGFDRTAAYNLYRHLLAPAESELRNKTHLFIAAAGSLGSLPFGILVTAPPEGGNGDPEALRSTPWFAEAHALVQLPSLQSLQLLRSSGLNRSAAHDDGSFAGFGDPVLGKGGGSDRGKRGARRSSLASERTRDGVAIADVSKLRNLPRLPGTAIELKNMKAALGAPDSSLRLGKAATEAAVRTADLSATRIIAFATHGLVGGEIDGAEEAGLVFTPPSRATEFEDGLLTSSEITTLKLNPDWVILSACNTAAGDRTGAPGLSGLARAFFYAGARTLLASHWPVRDDVAAELTVKAILLERSDKSLSRAQALQAAMRAIRNTVGDDSRAHPRAWAPFSLFGDVAR